MNLKLYLFLLFNILFVTDGLAVDKRWTGAISTNWNVAGNWSPAGVPTSNDFVYIDDVTNDPVIFSGTTALVKSISENQGSSLVVNSGAILTINPVISGVAHALYRATFTNNGTTRVESSSGGSASGVTAFDVTASTFTNNGVLVLNVGFSGFLPFGASSSTITNGTGATMSFLDGVGFKCNGGNPAIINNQGTINYSGPYFAIDLSTSGSSFTNTETGIVTISSGNGINVTTGATFSNLSCGKITAISLDNFGTVSNSGFLNVLYAITNSRTFTNTNTGVLKYGSVTGTITKNSGSVVVNDNPTNNTIFSYAGTFTGTVNGIYTDAAATTSAGTFTAPNTFIPLGLSLGEQTLYAKITPLEEGCTYIVPFTYTYVNPPNFTTSPTTKSVCSGSSTTFTVAASSATSYQWQVNTGGGFTNLSNTTPYSGVTNTTLNISNIAGLNGYQYRCVATGPGGSINSSSATLTVIIVTVANPATTLVTQGTAFSQLFTASGGATPYIFSLAGGSLPAGLSLNTTTGVVSGTPTVSGSFPVTVRSTDANGCLGTSATYTLVVNSSGPTISGFTTLDNTVCVGSPATFTATVGNVTGTYTFTLTNGVNTPVTGSRSGAAFSQNLTAAGTGTQSFTLIVSDNSQSVQAATGLTVSPLPTPVLTASNNGTLTCAFTSLTLTASGGNSYAFARIGGGGIVSTSPTDGTAVINSTGIYSVTVTSAAGCTATTTTTITSNTAAPIATISAPSTEITCAVTSITLTASGGGAYRWEDNSTNAIRPVSTAGTYSVTVTGTNGCTATASVSVSANQSRPSVSISPSSPTLSSTTPTASLTANGTGNFRWSTGETTQVISVSATGTYSVTLTTGSCSATATTSVEFIGGGDLTPILSLPQGNFAASGPESIHNLTMTIAEQAGKSTNGVIVLTLTAPLGYSLNFDPTLTSINVTGGTTNPVGVNNAMWEVRASNSLQLTLASKPGQRIGARSESVIGLSLSRSPVASAGTANLTVNVNDDPTGQYDANPTNNIYARILNSL